MCGRDRIRLINAPKSTGGGGGGGIVNFSEKVLIKQLNYFNKKNKCSGS
jgi:hypothetical protein